MQVRTSVFVIATALLVASFAVPKSINAQDTMLSVGIPFDFYFANERFVAGSYTIASLGPNVVRLSDGKGHTAVSLTNAEYISPRDLPRSSVTFNRYGDAYFLSEMRWSDYSTARSLPKFSAEVQLANGRPALRVIATSAKR